MCYVEISIAILPHAHPCRTVVCVRLLRLRLRRAPRAARARRRAPAAAREPRRAMGVASESVPCAGVWARCVRTHVCARVCACAVRVPACARRGGARAPLPLLARRERGRAIERVSRTSIYDYSKLCLNIFARISSRILMRCAQAP